MNERRLVAEALAQVIGEHLSVDDILTLLEQPKLAQYGDVAFPTFSLAKTMRKAPQQIAREIAEALPTQDFDEVNVVGLT